MTRRLLSLAVRSRETAEGPCWRPGWYPRPMLAPIGLRLWPILGLVLVSLLQAPLAGCNSGCASDADCKATSVCVTGVCLNRGVRPDAAEQEDAFTSLDFAASDAALPPDAAGGDFSIAANGDLSRVVAPFDGGTYADGSGGDMDMR